MPILVLIGIMVVATFLLYTYVGGRMNASDILTVASNAGFSGDDLTNAIAIALAESSGNPNASGDKGDSIGLWQIDTKYHPEYDKVSLTDPQYNANSAYAIYLAAGGSFTPWSTFKNGAYADYLADAQTAVDAASASGATSA